MKKNFKIAVLRKTAWAYSVAIMWGVGSGVLWAAVPGEVAVPPPMESPAERNACCSVNPQEKTPPQPEKETEPEKEPETETGQEPEAEVPTLWFPVGEQLEYRVYWGRIPVGTTRVYTEWVEKYDRTLLSIQFRTQSNRVLDRIYPVDDFIESLIDPVTFLPHRFTINLSEGRYRKHEITYFDYETMTAQWRSITRDREDTFELEPDTRDLVSFSYYMRKKGFSPGTRQHFRVMTDEKVYDLWLEAREIDRIRLRRYGRIPSIEVEPEAAFEGLFVRRGRVRLWISTDERRLLTQMVGEIPVANIRLVLHRVRGPGNDDWILDGDGDDDDDDEEDEE